MDQNWLTELLECMGKETYVLYIVLCMSVCLCPTAVFLLIRGDVELFLDYQSILNLNPAHFWIHSLYLYLACTIMWGKQFEDTPRLLTLRSGMDQGRGCSQTQLHLVLIHTDSDAYLNKINAN